MTYFRPSFRLAALTLSAVTGLAISPTALSQTVDNQITFSGSIPESCTLNVLTAGTLGVSLQQNILSSEQIGGIPATATITTNSASSVVSLINPADFATAPAGASADVTFGTNYILAGTTIAVEADGETQTALNLGLSTMTINASATKSSGTLPTGDYTLTPTLRCITP